MSDERRPSRGGSGSGGFGGGRGPGRGNGGRGPDRGPRGGSSGGQAGGPRRNFAESGGGASFDPNRAEKYRGPNNRPPLRIMTTTLWEYPSQHYTSERGHEVGGGGGPRSTMQGDKAYVGATPSWILWQLLQRYTRPGDVVLDPMVGSGTTIDVCEDLGRKPMCFDLVPSRPDIRQSDARKLPLKDESVDFAFVDPPYSTHVDYSDDPRCIGKLNAAGEDGGLAYFQAIAKVIKEMHRTLKDRRYMALYVSDSFRKRRGKPGGTFMPIGFEIFSGLCELFRPIDVICVVRHNQKLDRGNWRKAAEDGNFYLRGFNYLFIMKKEEEGRGEDDEYIGPNAEEMGDEDEGYDEE